ncbi:MAG: amidohydrolase family protein [Candidatus Nitronauta litoralis]|uniref:Amidohydrolase family protein n=1 Tax=Candidatus Nitronauta litoralis TaxID=2705533 RepID=A0A7T0BVH9_9BACT|nr:MAG: amidohydrolase family protein [Candidatus Nitronauta litoralis]
MKRILFGQLVTMAEEPDAPPLENGELLIDGENIVAINSQPSESFSGETIDLSDSLILPGFVNAHCHLSLSGLKGKIPQGLKFVNWIRQVVKLNTALPFTERAREMQIAAQEMLASGVTTLVDYFSHPELLPEYAQLPFRQVLLYEVLGFQKSKAEENVRRVESLLKEHTGHDGKIQLGLAPHAPYSVAPELYEKLIELAEKYQCLWSCHVAEVAEEQEFLETGKGPFRDLLEERGVWEETWNPPGVSPVKYLDEMDVLENMQAVHLNKMDEQDIHLLKRNNASAVFCPGSTRWFGRARYIPVRELLDAGIPVGLGTDSYASNDGLNFLREIRLAGAMLPDVSRAEILWMATVGGALASGISGGELVMGARADLIVFRLKNKSRIWWDTIFDQIGEGPDRVFMAGSA